MYEGYIYLIIDQLNNKKYIGQKTKPARLTEEYFGSGVIIKRKIKKYGKKFFKKIVLGSVQAISLKQLKTQLDKAETECIYFFRTYGADGCNVDEIYGYNLTKIGSSQLGTKRTKEQKQFMSKTSKNKWEKFEHPRGMLGKHHTKNIKKQISISTSKPKQNTINYKGAKKGSGLGTKKPKSYSDKLSIRMKGNTYGKKNKGSIGRVWSDKQKEEMSSRVSGNNNPMFGSSFEWYTNGSNNKRCSGNNKEYLINLGYYKGKVRIQSFRNKIT